MNSAVLPALAPTSSAPARLRAWRMRRANVEFAVLGMAATVIAFYAALLLELKAPATAAITVWVVANTRPGHVLSKSIYRVLGTILGAAASITIVSLLDSMPWMLFTALALWIAVCTGIGNMMRHFRAYFGLLAGYTAAFIVLGAYKQPDHVLDVALDRTSAIVIGVLSMSLVVSLLGVRRSAGDMEETLRGIHRKCLDDIRDRWRMTSAELKKSRLELSRSYVEAEAMLEYANLERPGFHLDVHELRALTGLLLDVVDASRLASHKLDRGNASPETRREIGAIFMEIREALEPAVHRQDEKSLAQARLALDHARRMIIVSAELALTPNERGLLLPIAHLLEEWIPRLDAPSLAAIPLRDPLQPDVRGAGRHVLRTFLGMMAAIIFWNLTGWQEGAGFLINGAAFCALASTSAHPARTLLLFSKATFVAAGAGFFCKFILMPHADGFGTLMLCLAAVLVPIGCCAFSRRPLLDTIGMTSGLFMLALIQPSNHMTYDPAQYASSAIAAVFGAFFLSVIFSLIMPTRPEKEAGKVLASLARSVRGLIDWPFTPSVHTWRLTAHRHLRNLQSKAMVTPSQLSEGLRLLDHGTSLLHLRSLSPSLGNDLKAKVDHTLLTPASSSAAATEVEEAPDIAESLRASLCGWLDELSATSQPTIRHDSGV